MHFQGFASWCSNSLLSSVEYYSKKENLRLSAHLTRESSSIMAWVLSSFTNRVLSKLDFVIWCSLLCVKRPVDFTLYACVCVCLKFPCVFTYHVNRELMDFVNIIFCALVIFAKRGWRSYHRLIFCIFGMMICVACSLVA